MSAPTSPADLYRHGLRLPPDGNIPARVGPRAEDGVLEFSLAALEPGTDFAGSSR